MSTVQEAQQGQEPGGAIGAAIAALAEALAEASRVAAEARDAGLGLNEAVGSLLPLEGLIEEAAALHPAVLALHRRARAAGAATTD